jgi:hypothetical protein
MTLSCFSFHHETHTWARWPLGPSNQAYLFAPHLEVSPTWWHLWVRLQLLMRMRTVSMWTRRNTEAWSGHSSTWRRWGRTSKSWYVCALVFKRLWGLRIGKQSSAYSGICDTLPTSAFGTPRLLIWLFMDFHMRILSGVGWIRSPLLWLASSWVLLWCFGLPANNRVLINPIPRQSMLP